MISFELSDDLVYNGIEDKVKKVIIKKFISTLESLEKNAVSEMGKFIPMNTKPAKSAKEFISFMNNIS